MRVFHYAAGCEQTKNFRLVNILFHVFFPLFRRGGGRFQVVLALLRESR